MANYLDKDGLLYFWQKIKNLFAAKSDAVSNITRSGTTFTATRADGTSFTFTQQDNAVAKTTTAPKMNGTAAVGSETKYAAGDHVHPSDTTKVDKVDGKGLSTNDYTDAEKTKLAGIAEGANAYTHPSYTARTGKPTANATPAFGATFTLSQITSDATGHVTAATDRTVKIPDTAMGAASADAAGTKGLVPAPAKGDQAKYLRGDGTWATPPNTNTDTKVNVTLATTTKAYLLGTSTTPTATAAGVTAVADTGVYLDTTAGKLTAASFAGNGAGLTSLNASNLGSGTVPAARLPAATSSAQGAMSAADKSKLDAFGAASTYALKSDITGMYKYKGSVATASALPTEDQAVGDVYNIEAASAYGGAGMNVAWNGTAWDPLGEIFTITSVTNAEIDAIVAS